MAKQTIFGLELDIPDNILNVIKQPSQNLIIIAILVVVIIFSIVGWWFLLRPMVTELDTLKTEVSALTQERDTKRSRVVKIPLLKEQAAKLQEQIAIMSKVVPPKGNVPILLIDLERLALKNNSKLTSFKNSALQPFNGATTTAQATTPAPTQQPGQTPTVKKAAIEDRLKELPVNITQDTTFNGLLKYTSDLEHYERVVRVNSIKIVRKPPTTTTTTPTTLTTQLSTTMDITAYVLEGGI